jgi:hypothetical protein
MNRHASLFSVLHRNPNPPLQTAWKVVSGLFTLTMSSWDSRRNRCEQDLKYLFRSPCKRQKSEDGFLAKNAIRFKKINGSFEKIKAQTQCDNADGENACEHKQSRQKSWRAMEPWQILAWPKQRGPQELQKGPWLRKKMSRCRRLCQVRQPPALCLDCSHKGQ